MKRFAGAMLIGLFAVAMPRFAEACPGCSNPNLPTARAGNFAMSPGEIALAVNLTGTTLRVVHSEYCPDIGPICNQRPEPPQLHDQRFYIGELRPMLGVGITNVSVSNCRPPSAS